MLENRFNGKVSIVLAYFLMLTTAMMPIRAAMAQNEFQQAVADANQFALELLQSRQNPQYDSNGNLIVDGQVYMSTEELTGQKGNDYLPAELNSFGSDGATIQQGQKAKSKYEEKTAETAETSAEKAYHVLRNSFARQKPDLSNDPLWANTDQVFGNLADIAKGFANCELTKELVSTGNTYHVPKYETCSKLPIIEENFSIFHEYKVGILKHHSGPVNLNSCGVGCMIIWLGTVADDYWPGSCTIYEEEMSLEVIQPSSISQASLEFVKYDDYFQVWLNDKKIYNGPFADTFPPETSGKCELAKSWEYYPDINVIDSFRDIPKNSIVKLKNRTSVTGNGEGFARIRLFYNATDLVYDESWSEQSLIDRAFEIQNQAKDGFCQATFTCADMPTTLDEYGCGVINGVRVCESNFGPNPMSELGVSALCRKVEVDSNCNFYQGEFCTENVNGVETCTPIDPKSADYNQCEQYENDSTCSFIKTECVEGAVGESGECYVQEDTYDCGFDVSNGIPSEQDVLRCDGQIQCIGESCYSPVRDTANGDFGEVNAYLEMLKYAQSDMECVGIPDRPFDPISPPDRYTPVPSCDEGYYYDKDSKKCLSKTACAYDDNNFYAASQRNGIQIVLNNQVVKDEPNIPICSTIINGSKAYTCGEARKKVSTDTFYEVCVNDVDEPTPNTCPSSEHDLNENTGFCEVPPFSSCKDGFQLIEGDDIWSLDDDICRMDVPVKYLCEKEFENYNNETGLCEGLLNDDAICQTDYELESEYCKKSTKEEPSCKLGEELIDGQCREIQIPQEVCPDGYEKNGDLCEAINFTDVQFKCPVGWKMEMQGQNDPRCLKEDTECRYDSNNYVEKIKGTECSGKSDRPVNTTSGIWNGSFIGGYIIGSYKTSFGRSGDCAGGNAIYSNTVTRYEICKSVKLESEATAYCPNGWTYREVGIEDVGSCYQVVDTTPIKLKCETGFTLDLNTNKCIEDIGDTPICPLGFNYNVTDNICEKNEFHDPICEEGYSYNVKTLTCELKTTSQPQLSCDVDGASYYEPNNVCRIEEKAVASCPSLYPVWNESEGRCVSGSLSPYAKNDNKKESREQMDYALAPFAELFEAFIPKAMADEANLEELSDEKQHVSKETMTKYIANKFETAAESFEEQKALVAQGREMFMSTLSGGTVKEEPVAYAAMSRSAPSAPMAASAAPTEGNAGTTNVQCELFKAEAMECKKAVGGMKDCCESPVAPSLGDYITLTRHMMTMDAITGQVFGLENYSGVWETASTWGSATVESAWSAIQGEFVSPADIVAQSGTENVTQGLVSEMAQAIMSYTNDFLIDTFGQEVASMFFQEVGQNAAGEAVIGASPQMAAVGQAMMYCYYAYLAYVVFNLLVNIIFACTDEELDLAMKIELLSAHYIGSYCKSKVLGACIEKRKVYCSFDSPLSRIIMEQIYMQPHMGLSWGSPKNPSCAGLKIEDISKVNWDAINLDEWTGILIKTGNFIADEQLDLDRLTGSKSKLNFGKDSDARQNVLEKNTERFDNVNIDELKRDAYEDGWNKFQ